MIRVTLKDEPDDFESKVRTPGLDFLKLFNRPRGKDWKGNEFWRRALTDMRTSYNDICAYSSLWMVPDQPTIDHYISRDDSPKLAYEWANFRLARWRINTRKNIKKGVIDPFQVGKDWFHLDFTTFEIHPNPELPNYQKASIEDTLEKLDLNNNDYVMAREAWFSAFKNNIAKLAEKSPFIAYEMTRQNIIP